MSTYVKVVEEKWCVTLKDTRLEKSSLTFFEDGSLYFSIGTEEAEIVDDEALKKLYKKMQEYFEKGEN